MEFIAKIKVFDKPQPIQEVNGVRSQASQYHYITIQANSFDGARCAAEKYADGKPINYIGKHISKKEAHEKYGVIISGANSYCRHFLTEDGYIVDDCDDIRYIPEIDPRGILQGARL